MNTRENRVARFESIDVYPVISSEFTNGRGVLDVLRRVFAGGAGVAQIREKTMSKRDLYELCLKCVAVAADAGALLIVNDHVDVALATGADGVHLGQNDFPLAAAREIAPDLVVGASTHDEAEAVAAQRAGADYVNLGPLFPTATKATGSEPLGIEIVKRAPAFLTIPFTVMGGIKLRHVAELTSAGARRIAMVTEITEADDVRGKVRAIRAAIRRGVGRGRESRRAVTGSERKSL